MDLKRLSKYKRIVIQCHDVPDADAIGTGFALQCYLRSLGTEAVLVYGGAAEIQKPSLLMLLDSLGIEINYVSVLPEDTDLLITVDCQRGAGNVKNFELPDTADVIVIDHHRPEIPENENTVICPHLASCATLMWDLLNKEGFVMDDPVQTALYFGLYSDTNGMSELRHPLDRDLAEITCDSGLVRKLKSSAITTQELDIIGRALRNREIIGGVGLFRAEPCDANLLGFASDIVQQVVHIDCCVVYCMQPHGIKLSVRSSAREIMASEIAAFLCRGAGGGGGTLEKAGGYMSFKGIAEASDAQEPEDFIKDRIREYISHYDLIYAGKNDIDFSAMKLYKKLPNPVGFAKSADIVPDGTKITVRTLEGDVDLSANDDIYLMIGIKGEVYPIKKQRFELSYDVPGIHYSPELEYVPAIINRFTGERHEILPYAKTCVPNNEKLVRAVQIERAAKVFTQWDTDKYFSGVKGDWLVANEGSFEDCYIVRSDIFEESYVKNG
jgi:phosphoglycolate phosphatase